jgi:hypothetical protein
MTKVKIDRRFSDNEVNAIVSAIEHENDLIGQRTNWLVMGQAFLFAAFASLPQQGDVHVITRGVKLMRFLIPLVGLLLPVLVLLAVSAATYAIWQWRSEHNRLCKVLEAKGLEWPSIGPASWVVVTGQVLPIAVALGFGVGMDRYPDPIAGGLDANPGFGG